MLQKIFSHIKKILVDTHTKIWTEITDTVVFRKKLLKFLQGAYVRNCITRNCDSRLHASCWVNLLSTFPPWIHCILFTVRSGLLFACHMFCNYAMTMHIASTWSMITYCCTIATLQLVFLTQMHTVFSLVKATDQYLFINKWKNREKSPI